MSANPSDDELRALLRGAKRIAVVGLSPKPDRPSHRIARRLIDWGYEVVPVRPALAEVLGRKAYARLADVPGTVDLVDVFRAPGEIGPIVDDCIARGLPALWLQEGVVNALEAARARAAGITVVMDRCISVDHRRLLGATA
ncbi:MAG TPA: CoA-binding protein [Burkholderiales bacterium]